MTPEERYEDLVDEFSGVDGVTPPAGGSGFGRGALRCRRKIFAMFVRGQLVVKLPGPRVDQLVAGGHGERFDASKGTPMKEWFSLDPGSTLPWPPLASEALDFARSLAGWPPSQPASAQDAMNLPVRPDGRGSPGKPRTGSDNPCERKPLRAQTPTSTGPGRPVPVRSYPTPAW
ncbi:MAG: hypothetical protein ACRDOH_16440 [Streptosporangiaceae bacterium]